MHLYDIPMIFVLIGLALYVVLAGADFGAGIWQLLAGTGPQATRLRDHAHDSMSAVWEANHVWLIFVLTVTWTAYPVAFGSLASTLSVPLFIAALGIIFRGAAYALRSGVRSRRELRTIDLVFSISSIITPFALGTMVGAIATRRVPVGNARGGLWSSWTGSTSILIGVVAVTVAAYLAAVYLAADAARQGERALESMFRTRALIAGVLSGALALAGLVVVHADAHPLYHGLISGDGRSAVIISVLAGAGTLALVWYRRFALARYCAALAVAAIIAGWALAQQPLLLPHLTISQAAGGHDTLVAVIVAVVAGGLILFPSLALLFRLVLSGTLDPSQGAPAMPPSASELLAASGANIAARVAAAAFIGALGFLTAADAAWAHTVGLCCLLVFALAAFVAVRPIEMAREADP
ncbi:MAG TPA: cytochrome d ubiquinol oxidase subunit II [Solirubrobacteraceae bacterium]|jgi:cytochrome d ubiquinol oxidase subunit II